MQEVSGSIPLGSTSFAGKSKGHSPAKLPKRQRRADLIRVTLIDRPPVRTGHGLTLGLQ